MDGRSTLITIWLALIIAVQAKAAERFEFYNGVRQMGMGGAAVAVVNDETALMLNPANLGKLRDFILTVADPEIEGTGNAISIGGFDMHKMIRPQDLLNKLNDAKNLGKRLSLKGQVFPSLVVPNFGVGLFAKYQISGMVDETGTDFELNYFNDYAIVTGFNFRLFDGIIKLGFNARAVNRIEIQRTDIPANSTGLSVNGLAKEGIGIGSDLGLTMSAPVAWLPTIAAVWRDVGDTSYSLKEGMFTSAISIPAQTPEAVDVAIALYPIISNRVRSTFTIEYRDVLTTSDEEDHMRRTHVGYEINVADAFFIRAGMNQRYWTAGVEFAAANFQLQAATYGEEVGLPDATVEDRRYIGKFSIRF